MRLTYKQFLTIFTSTLKILKIEIVSNGIFYKNIKKMVNTIIRYKDGIINQHNIFKMITRQARLFTYWNWLDPCISRAKFPNALAPYFWAYCTSPVPVISIDIIEASITVSMWLTYPCIGIIFRDQHSSVKAGVITRIWTCDS